MNLRPLIGLLLFALMLVSAPAQNTYYDFGFERDQTVPVVENGQTLLFPWAGGLNSVRFSEIDLDLDGVTDLLGFEKHGNRLLPFLRQIHHYSMLILIH